jgi:hypothetical protein
VKQKQKLEDRRPDGAWTKPEAYVVAMARKRTFRRTHDEKPRTQPERPRLLLSTVPFLLLILLVGVLAVGIMVLAFPGNQPQHRPMAAAQPQKGVAERGWFQEAQREMHR